MISVKTVAVAAITAAAVSVVPGCHKDSPSDDPTAAATTAAPVDSGVSAVEDEQVELFVPVFTPPQDMLDAFDNFVDEAVTRSILWTEDAKGERWGSYEFGARDTVSASDRCPPRDEPMWWCEVSTGRDDSGVFVWDTEKVSAMATDASGGASVLAYAASTSVTKGDRHCAAGEYLRWLVDGGTILFTVTEDQARAAANVFDGQSQQDSFLRGLTEGCAA